MWKWPCPSNNLHERAICAIVGHPEGGEADH